MGSSNGDFVTLQQIADLARVHKATVSLALRNSPRVSQRTREKIQQIASRLGYRLNLNAAHLSHLRSERRSTLQGVLAYVHHQDSEPLTNDSDRRLWRQEIRRCAENLGYKAEIMAIDAKNLPPRHLHRILQHRSISGIILEVPDCPDDYLRFAEVTREGFAVVTLGRQAIHDGYHHVGPDTFDAVHRAIVELRDRGYVRPTLFLTALEDWAYRYRASAAWTVVAQVSGVDPLPLIRTERTPEPRAFARQLDQLGCDVVVGYSGRFLKEATALCKTGVAWADLNAPAAQPDWSGVEAMAEECARQALELLVGQLQRHEHSAPSVPLRISLIGRWRDGKTACARTATAR